MLFTDARALRVNDLVVIKVEEVADARRSANTDIDRSSESSAEISAFLGLLAKLRSAGPGHRSEARRRRQLQAPASTARARPAAANT